MAAQLGDGVTMESKADFRLSRRKGEEGAHPLESLLTMLGALPDATQLAPELRLCLIAQIDDDARAALDAPSEASDGPFRPGRKAATVARELFGGLLDAYHQCLADLEGAACPASAGRDADDCRIRFVRAAAERLKWERCVGGPAHPELWSRIGKTFGRVVHEHEARSATGFGAGGRLGTSVGREYLRAVAVYTAAFDRVTPDHVPALDRLIEFSLPMLDFRLDSSIGAVCLVAPERGDAPRRILPGVPVPRSTWFLGTRVARGALQELAEQLACGLVPLGFEREDRATLAAALQHLSTHWSEAPRMRRYRRHATGGRLTAVRGIDDLRQLFAGESVSYLAEWEFRDVSRGGIGVFLPAESAASICVGELVGILPHDGDVWQFGIVRHAWTRNDGSMLLGLEALAQKPVLVSADDGVIRTDVFLCDPLLRGEAVRIAVPANTLRTDVSLSIAADGAIHELTPLDSVMSGEGFELRVYQVA